MNGQRNLSDSPLWKWKSWKTKTFMTSDSSRSFSGCMFPNKLCKNNYVWLFLVPTILDISKSPRYLSTGNGEYTKVTNTYFHDSSFDRPSHLFCSKRWTFNKAKKWRISRGKRTLSDSENSQGKSWGYRGHIRTPTQTVPWAHRFHGTGIFTDIYRHLPYKSAKCR